MSRGSQKIYTSVQGIKWFSIDNLFISNMYQKISEPIDVLAVFSHARTEPMMFKWGNRYFQVKRVHVMDTEIRDKEKIHLFSVSDGEQLYRLSFSTESLKWRLEEVAAA